MKLKSSGYNNSALLYDALNSPEARADISGTLGVDRKSIDSLYVLVDLTRIQWVSPTAARMLVAAGYDSTEKISRAGADALWAGLDRVNRKHNYFKGTTGLRDVKRLIKAASYVQ